MWSWKTVAAAVEAAASGCGRGARRDPPPPPPPQLPPPPAAPAPRRTRALAARAPPAPTGPTPTRFSQGPALPAVPNRLCPNCARATLRGPPPLPPLCPRAPPWEPPAGLRAPAPGVSPPFSATIQSDRARGAKLGRRVGRGPQAGCFGICGFPESRSVPSNGLQNSEPSP
ncbi:proline-rich protein 2-like [Macaca nemestrina]|uniref:proline-rich protein 2-like n=1 Tax=Macaca nemestrina TaxID=9545 RepID=UPI0039B94D5A